MEKYLNSNFAEADEKSIKDLQNYLNKLGYKNSKNEPLAVDGDFGAETKQALKQAREEYKVKKALKPYCVKILDNNGFNKFLNEVEQKLTTTSSTLSNINTIVNGKESNREIITRSRTLAANNKNSIFLLANYSGTGANERRIPEILSNKSIKFETSNREMGGNGQLKQAYINGIEKSHFGYLIDYDFLIYSDDPRLKCIERFDDVRVPAKPKKRVVEILPEPTLEAVPVLTPQPSERLKTETQTEITAPVKEEKPKEKTTKVEIIDNRKMSKPANSATTTKPKKEPKKQGCLSEEEWQGFCEMVEQMGSLDASEQKQINERISEINRLYQSDQIRKLDYNEQGKPTIEYYRHTCFQEGKSSVKTPLER